MMRSIGVRSVTVGAGAGMARVTRFATAFVGRFCSRHVPPFAID